MWKLKYLWVVVAIMLLGSSSSSILIAQNAPGQRVGENPCPLCGQPWRGRVDPEVTIPEKLPTPKNQEWLSKLRQVLMMAKRAKAQYEADQKKFGITNPYRYIIPQIDHHIDQISKLFAAYGLSPNGKSSAIHNSPTVLEALEYDKEMAANLATQYEWLLNHNENKNTKELLNFILTQTKMQYIMFDNAIRLLKIQGTMAPLLL